MKILIKYFLLLVFSTANFSQTLTLTMDDGATFSFNLNTIDSIYFTTYATGQCSHTIFYAGKLYHTVEIEGQCWLKENLDVGEMILGNILPADNDIIEKYCYENDPNNCDEFGGLYTWNEAMNYSSRLGSQGICPPGWHIPTLGDYEKLINSVYYDGNSLKEIGQGTGSGEGTNLSGFSALLAGYRYLDGSFFDLGVNAFFWSSAFTEDNAFYMHLKTTKSNIYLNFYEKEYGFCLRCVKD